MIAKSFPHISARHLREAIDRLPELQGINLRFEQIELLFSVAERIAGFPRHIALHPCGIVLASHDLVERVPLERSANGHRMIQADKDDVELLGYLKLDVLGVRMLCSMRHALDEIARTTGEKVDLDRIPLDDEPTFELIRRSDTLGCFQIESPGQRELLQKLQPTRWEDLIVDISLVPPRPREVRHDRALPAAARRDGASPLHPPGPARTAAGDPRGDRLPRAGDPDPRGARRLHRDLRRPRPPPPRRRGAAPVAASRLPRARRSPAASSPMPPRRPGTPWPSSRASASARPTPPPSPSRPTSRAYLKAHYPAHLIAGLLTHDPGMYPRRLILEDARHHDIEILPLDVNESEPDYVVEEVGTRKREGPPRASTSAASEASGDEQLGGEPDRATVPTPTLRGPARPARTFTGSRTRRSGRSCRRAPSGRSPTWGTSCGGPP